MQNKIMFSNGYGASIISNEFSYGGSKGLFEIAVTDSKEELVYDTPITSDVIGHCTKQQLGDILIKIMELKPKEKGKMTREEFWTWLDTHTLGDYDIHEDNYGAIVIGFPIVEHEDEQAKQYDKDRAIWEG